MRWYIISLVLLLLTSSAYAAVSVTPIVNDIHLGETAEFAVVVTNSGEATKTYKIYSLGAGWVIDSLPQDRSFRLNPGESKHTRVTAKPVVAFKPGLYGPSFNLDSYEEGASVVKGGFSTQSHDMEIYLRPEGPIDYVPTLRVETDMLDKIKPQDSLSVKLTINNLNPLNLSNLKLQVQSDLTAFERELDVPMNPLEQKTLEFSVQPSPYEQPKEYKVFFVFKRYGETVKIVEQQIEIESVLPSFELQVEKSGRFLKTTNQVNVRNSGNVLNTQDVEVPIGFWKGIFTTGGDIVLNDNDQRVVRWTLKLQPDETKVVEFVTNFRILVYVVVLLLLLVGFYWYVQSPVVLRKSAVVVKSDREDGSLSEIKVTLELSNKTKKPIEYITIKDTVPAIANVEKSLALGTLRPKEVRHGKRGTKVIWALTEIDAHEHRIITYKIRAKLNILGTFSLPRGVIEYGHGKKKRKAYSNIFRLGE